MSLIMLRRGSVSGSSSVTITISASWSASFPISGLLNLSLFHGAPNARIVLPVPFIALMYVSDDLRAFGVCAKSTK